MTTPRGHVPHFFVTQRITAMVNRYEVRLPDAAGGPGEMVALAQQKRMKLREEVVFFADEARSVPVFSFRSRQVVDAAAQTDVLADDGTPVGWFEKDFAKSLLRSTWHLHYPGATATGTERSQAIALVRRFVDIPLRFHFDFTDTATGAPVMSVERQPSLRDRYEVRVPDPRVDVRLAAAMAVALDAFQAR